ncbi:helix-turn-helix transcriptional regulator [Vallitalea pronyensis]|uniref:Helix-turn-helix transcriptional regulator n=1 Tax=Vallitalea pronyensis TaxID=1348613 RepID=A0A8J8MK00_9FIRM|nr:AraC family transcriptional regulator [Vallitalea pronyensis]QUI23060.1 helix-turn-helix transcriptional regulator [Vallitalea pronyensis]
MDNAHMGKTLFSTDFQVFHQRSDHYTMDFHFHDLFEIYFNVSGGDRYLIENKVYKNNPGDLFVLNNYEVHKVMAKKDTTYERVIIIFKPEYIDHFSIEDNNLLQCFLRRKRGHFNKIHLSKEQQRVFLNHVTHLTTIQKEKFGSNLLKKTYFIQLLIYINQWFMDETHNKYQDQIYDIHETVEKIIDYIDHHLADHMSLEQLAKEFNISKYYLCQLFKKNTGVTVNHYITARRIAEAKKLLHAHKNVSEVAERTGFNDYTHFIRTFKKWVGMPPKRYTRTFY